MWKVVYIAQNQSAAMKIKEFLTANSFLVQIKNINPKNTGHGAYEISVPYSEAEEAYEILCSQQFRG